MELLYKFIDDKPWLDVIKTQTVRDKVTAFMEEVRHLMDSHRKS